MPSEIREIRQLTPDDSDSLISLLAESHKFEPLLSQELPLNDPALNEEWVKARLTKDSELEKAFIIGAFVDELKGMVAFYRERPGKLQHRAVLWGLYVDHNFRRKGIGAALLRHALKQASECDGLEQMHLYVPTSCRAAITLFEHTGFESCGFEPQALKTPLGYADRIHMMMLL
jgi:ribosomal protein S18 acetylase RimI-like enzyme